MRIKSWFLWGLVAILVAYSVAWVFISRTIQSKVHDRLDQLKKERVIEAYHGDIKVTGFPFSFKIKFIHPRVKFSAFPGDMLFDGVLTVGFSLFSNKIRTYLNGDLHARMNVNGQPFDLALSSKDLIFKVALADSLIWTGIKMAISKEAKSESLSAIRAVTFHAEDCSLMNKLTNKTLFYIENDDLIIKMKRKKNSLKIDYSEKVSNVEFQEEFNSLSRAIRSLSEVRKVLESVDINVRNYFDVFSPDKFGKMDHEVVLSLEKENDKITIDLDTFVFNDSLQKIDLPGRFIFSDKGIVADAKFEGAFSSKWYELMKIYATKLDLNTFFGKTEAKIKAPAQKSIFSIIFGTIWGFVHDMFGSGSEPRPAYVPKLHEMGKITSKADIAYAKMSNGFDLQVNDFKLKANQFSVQLNGDVHNHGVGDIYNLKAKLQNYPYIVDTASDYMNRIFSSMGRVLFIFNRQLNLSPPVKNKIKLFLRSVSDDPEASSDNLSLTAINKDGRTYPSVGKYNSEEFKVVWNNFVLKVIFMQIEGSLESFGKLLANPVEIPLEIGEVAGKTVKKLAESVLGLLEGGSR